MPGRERIHTIPDAQPSAPLAAGLAVRYGHLQGAALLAPMIRREFAGRIAVTSSFGTEAAVLLALVAEVDPATPVVFIDTGRLFGETRRYRDRLVGLLGLRDVRTVRPDPNAVAALDPRERLWRDDADACCHLRKVQPLAVALEGFDAWITGRKRSHGDQRSRLPPIEAAGRRVKLNPLASYDADDVAREFTRRGLPRHPLEAEGYRSVGCMPCTARVTDEQGVRAGRWPGSAKTECGIHRLA